MTYKLPIEEIDFNQNCWVVLYLHDWSNEGVWPEIHGWYDNEKDADEFVKWAHEPGKPPRYWVRKAWKRVPKP